MIHDPKPITLIPELRKSIDRMLWYVPGIASVQSYENYLVDDLLYSEAIIEIILDELKMHIAHDVKIVNERILDQADVSFYEGSICKKCQKIIITKSKSESILRAMLRHIRNGIAHGSFTTIGSLALFIDQNKNGKTGLLKIDVVAFEKIIELIEKYDGLTEENVLARVFEKLGYEVSRESKIGNIVLDLLITKDGLKYGIEIKSEKRSKIVGFQDDMIVQLYSTNQILKEHGITPVFIYDKSRTSDKAKNSLLNEGILLLDRKNIAEIINKKDIVR